MPTESNPHLGLKVQPPFRSHEKPVSLYINWLNFHSSKQSSYSCKNLSGFLNLNLHLKNNQSNNTRKSSEVPGNSFLLHQQKNQAPEPLAHKQTQTSQEGEKWWQLAPAHLARLARTTRTVKGVHFWLPQMCYKSSLVSSKGIWEW